MRSIILDIVLIAGAYLIFGLGAAALCAAVMVGFSFLAWKLRG